MRHTDMIFDTTRENECSEYLRKINGTFSRRANRAIVEVGSQDIAKISKLCVREWEYLFVVKEINSIRFDFGILLPSHQAREISLDIRIN